MACKKKQEILAAFVSPPIHSLVKKKAVHTSRTPLQGLYASEELSSISMSAVTGSHVST
jgi:hypothetical protein